MKSVPDMLRECAKTFEERAAVYGENYKEHGELLVALFDGQERFNFQDPKDWNRMVLSIHIVAKLKRYTNNWDKGGHEDSLLDLSVYSQMLRDVDHDEGQLTNDELFDQFMMTLPQKSANGGA